MENLSLHQSLYGEGSLHADLNNLSMENLLEKKNSFIAADECEYLHQHVLGFSWLADITLMALSSSAG